MDKPLARIEDILGDQGGRRRDPRYACAISGTVTSDRGSFPCQIVNLSQGGLSVQCEEKLQKGETVTIAGAVQESAPELAPLSCNVAWVTKTSGESHARLTLLEPIEGSWLGRELAELSRRARLGLQRRSSLRVATDLQASLNHREQSFPARVVNLGSHGARVECSAPLDREASVVLTLEGDDPLPSLVLNAVVIAAHDPTSGHYGVAFAGFAKGSASDLSLYLNRALEVKRR